MTTTALPGTTPSSSPLRWILIGALVVGACDLTDAFIFFGLRGASPVRILQSISAGLLGRDSFTGGFPTALLGLGLHFTIALAVVSTYYAASRTMPVLTRHPVWCGLVYGVLVYLVMTRIVVPLSAAPQSRLATPVLVNGLLIHLFGVGLPAALCARRARMAQTGAG